MQNMTRKLFLAALFALLPLELAAAPKDNYPEPTTVSDEDSDYVKCLQAATEFTDDETALCMDGEIKRLDRALNNLYRNVFLKEERIQKWNNGNGMFRGNIKDMQDQFTAYRARFCSFYAQAMQNYSGSQAYLRNECMMQLTNEYYTRLLNISRSYDADLD